MIDALKKTLAEWDDKTNQRQKLQHSYALIIFAGVVVAGVIGLLDYHLGQKLLLVAILATFILICNTVVWALLQSLVLLNIQKPKPAQKKKR